MAQRMSPVYRPKRKQERSAPVILRAVEVVAQRLLEEDESLIRIPEICEEAEVNYGSVYHHFGSREGLIEAAYVHLFAEIAREDNDQLLEVAKTSTTRKQFFTGMRRVLRSSIADPERPKRRQMRVRILAAALVRPSLQQAIGEIQEEATNTLTEMCTIAQDKGWFRKDLDARAMAAMLQVVVIGRVLDDVSTHPLSDTQWGPVVAASLSAFVEQ